MKKFTFAFSVAVAALSLLGCGVHPSLQITHPATSAQVSSSGILCVQVNGPSDLGRFSILSTVKDINKLIITVSGPGLHSPLVQNFTALDIANRTASAMFSSLPVGTYSIQVSALGNSGELLGSASADSKVSAGQTTTVCLVVRLDANVGNLGVGVSFQEVNPTASKSKNVNCDTCEDD